MLILKDHASRALRAWQLQHKGVQSDEPAKIAAEGIRALGGILGSLADMFSVLGNYRVGEKIRKGKVMADKIAVSLFFIIFNIF